MTRLGRRSCWLLSTLVLMVTILLLASAVPAGAQVTSAGQVNGVVTDKTGAVVPGAAITLTDTSTQEQRNSTSNAAGQYVFVNVPPGKYNITAVKTGAVVPGAAITLTDTSTQEQRNSTSNAAGQYVFVNVPPGKYNITVVK